MTEYINTIFQFLMEDTFRKLNVSSGKEASKFLFPVKIGTPHAASVSNTKLSHCRLNKLECTNEKLRSCNQLSAAQYEKAAQNFKYYTRLLVEMRRDVDVAFKRIQ